MRFVFVMDPISTINASSDTSFALMEEAAARGHRVEHALATDVFYDRDVRIRTRRATLDRNASTPVSLASEEEVHASEIDAVFIRKDPPFDAEYLWLTQILELARHDTVFVNDPRGLREANEKLYTLLFPEVAAETLVTSDQDAIRRFVARVGGRAVIKAIDGYAGTSVFSLTEGDANFGSVIEAVSARGRRHVIVQRFLPEIATGDKRILLLDGAPLGAFYRVPQGGDLRSNLRVGGRAVPCDVSEADERIIARIAPRLREDGLVFVGLDVIGDRLTEVNCTSPTGIQQMTRLLGTNLSARVIEAVERRVEAA